MSSFFEKLKRFRAGESLANQLRARRLNVILDVIERNQLVPGRGYRIQKTNSGTVLTIEGGGGGSAQPPSALQITRTQQPGNTDESTEDRFYITWGTINNLIPDNIHSGFDMPANGSSAWVYLRANLSEASPYYVQSATIQVESSQTSGPSFGEDGTWPDYILIALGRWQWSAPQGQHILFQGGNGSISLAIYAHSWSCSAAGPRMRFGVSWNRLAP